MFAIPGRSRRLSLRGRLGEDARDYEVSPAVGDQEDDDADAGLRTVRRLMRIPEAGSKRP